ncbi:MAG: carboxypeptidase-like regulatory domain-containing protein, partial [Candidatus Marinimicrobia bacterium]|nr:carboxypeptidase-like regulatory domain-containing protein [Candidatus Neomarinimicrobiota bacterium]MCF7840407.1 carboxypeptidase-like regulatory domain-containing protein [Candidatus Neomarinimicrobiota bacterium]
MVSKISLYRLSIFLFALAIPGIFTGCWEKQDHDLLLPETPHYQLTGTVVDEVTQLPLPDIQVIVKMGYSLYNVEWQTLTLHTDSAGFFQIDTIYPGSYIMD